MKDYDFGGWVTRSGVRCSDGRIIMKDAFIECDGITVPLVWNHSHDNVHDVLGHITLQHRDEGVYGYGKFNSTESGNDAKEMVENGDLTSLSIYATRLSETSNREVKHGEIKEVSLVLAGANPGAYIDCVMAHSDDEYYEAKIYNNEDNLELFHSEEKEKNEMGNEEKDEKKESTIGDVLETLNEDQKKVVDYLLGKAAAGELNDNKEEKENKEMAHNLFDNEEMEREINEGKILSHSDMVEIAKDAKRIGSLREAVLQHAESYGISDLKEIGPDGNASEKVDPQWLFPNYRELNATPAFIQRKNDWVAKVMNGVHHTPFARIKMTYADLRADDARAKGYAQKGKLKKEEVFGLLKRSVGPTTVYKKQKIDRDDEIDITDFNVISWLKSEMRMMLDEELARAYIFGDGRENSSEDKIKEDCIIPVVKENPLFTISVTVTPKEGESLAHAIIDAAVRGQNDYEGSGNTTAFMTNNDVTEMLLLEDKTGHRLYKDMRDLALAMSVNEIVKVPAAVMPANIHAVIVDLADYNVGADKGGAVSMFEDFDIDYNRQKYLIETRCSGALTKPFSAVILKKNASSVAAG